MMEKVRTEYPSRISNNKTADKKHNKKIYIV